MFSCISNDDKDVCFRCKLLVFIGLFLKTERSLESENGDTDGPVQPP